MSSVVTETQKQQLKQLPGVDRLLEITQGIEEILDAPRSVITRSVRDVVDTTRQRILKNSPPVTDAMLSPEALVKQITLQVKQAVSLNLVRTVNATGVVVHTNMGRSLLCDDALAHVQNVATRYSNLEMNLSTGKRGLRYSAVEDILCEITGAEAAMVVNNNAAAVLLCLDTLANGKEVIVSRGELVEIGGSFRIPDVMSKSGGILKEVGTTNRTHARDYENAITDQTGLLLKVHTSNFAILGFTASVSMPEMVALGQKHNVPVMEDLGSGMLIDFSKYGLTREPTVQDSVKSGADIVTFSGDKLLGGPQAGIIVGRRAIIDDIRKNQMTRALRIDKLTLAALESTMRLYRDESKAISQIPTLRMLTQSFDAISEKADDLSEKINALSTAAIQVEKLTLSSRAGGGSLPIQDLPSRCLGISVKGKSASAIEKQMRRFDPPVIGRIENDMYIIDLRTVQPEEMDIIAKGLKQVTETM